MNHTVKFLNNCGKCLEVGDSDGKGWQEVEMDYIIPNGRGVGIKPFTFACGSIPCIAWFANTIVSSNSIEA